MRLSQVTAARLLVLLSILYPVLLVFQQDILLAMDTRYRVILASFLPSCSVILFIVWLSAFIIKSRGNRLWRWEIFLSIGLVVIGLIFSDFFYHLRDIIHVLTHEQALNEVASLGKQLYSSEMKQEQPFSLPSDLAEPLGQNTAMVLSAYFPDGHWIAMPGREDFIVYVDGEFPIDSQWTGVGKEGLALCSKYHVGNWFFCALWNDTDHNYPFEESSFRRYFE